MKHILLLLFFTFTLQIKAQTVEATPTIPTENYLDLLVSNLELPEAVNEKYANSTLELTIILTITKEGTVFNPKIKNDSLQLEPNLKKAIETLPKWHPKTENGNAVVSRKIYNLIIPIIPKTKDDETTAELSKPYPSEGTRNFYRSLNSNFDESDFIGNGLKAVAEFMVEEDGSLTDIKIIKSNTPSANNKLIRIIKSMPKWKPATQNGIPIRVKFRLPITIKHQE